jgi:hypothetical protein
MKRLRKNKKASIPIVITPDKIRTGHRPVALYIALP